MTLREIWSKNSGKFFALVLTALLGLLGYNVLFGESEKFLDENAPTSAPVVTPVQ